MISTNQLNKPLVSVVIPTRNRAPLLREAIESVLAVQSTDFLVEILVVDDGSTDNTAEVLSAYSTKVLRTHGQGASAARNAGMAGARGKYITFLDDDDLWLPNNLVPQLTLLEANPSYGAAYAQAQCSTASGMPYGDPAPQGPLSSGWIFADLLEHWPQIGTVVVRATVAREIGGLDVSLRSEEEWDWLLRIAERYQIGRVAEPVLLFRQRAGPDDLLSWRRFPDTVRVFKRRTGPYPLLRRLGWRRTLWRHRGWYAALFLNDARRYAQAGNRRAALRCLGYACGASPLHTLRARATIQQVLGKCVAKAATPRVLVANYSGYIVGDDAMFEALVGTLREGFGSDVEVAALTCVPDYTAKAYPRVDVVGHVYDFLESRDARSRVRAAVARADLLVIGGGDLIEGQLAFLVLALLAKVMGTALVFVGVGVVPPADPHRRRVLRWTANMARYIITRDPESAQLLTELGVTKPAIGTLPDIAVGLRQGKSAPRTGARRLAVVNLREPDRQYSMTWGEKEYAACAQTCRALIDGGDFDLLFVPFAGFPEREQELLETLLHFVDRPGHVRMLSGNLSSTNVVNALAGADLAIGMRLQFLVLAA